jgi:uncharacterized protein (TIGR02391 family)
VSPGFGPPEGPPANRGKPWPSEILTPYEVDLLFEAKNRRRSHELRDRAMLALMYRASLKVGQISALLRTGYKQPSRQLTVPRGKRPPEVMALDAETAAALDHWIEERRRLSIRSAPMFCPLLHEETRGRQLRTSNIRHILHGRVARAGLDRRVNPEAVRQSGLKYLGEPGSISAYEFHPDIARAAAQLVADGHYDSAVRAGAIALRDVLRDRSGLHHLDGLDLASSALGGDEPPIVLADMETREGRNEQLGWASLARACFAALRNAVAHRDEYTRLTGMEALATMSLVARRVSVGRPPA